MLLARFPLQNVRSHDSEINCLNKIYITTFCLPFTIVILTLH